MIPRNVLPVILIATILLFISCSDKKEENKTDNTSENKTDTAGTNNGVKNDQVEIGSNDVEVAVPGIDSWIGTYEYNEKPAESNGGYNMVMNWILTISKESDGLKGILEINGQQTFIKMKTNIVGDGKYISVLYNEMADGMDQNLQKNSVLFTITKKNGTMETSFDALVPRLTENPQKVCECFLPKR